MCLATDAGRAGGRVDRAIGSACPKPGRDFPGVGGAETPLCRRVPRDTGAASARRFLRSFAVTLLLATQAAVAEPAARSPSVASVDAQTLREEAGDVAFVVSIPAACRSQSCGLIVDVHGGLMDADAEDEETGLRRLGRLAPDYGASAPYIVLNPELRRADHRWSEGDVAPILAFVDRLQERYRIRSNDRHFGGFSQGGIMAAWLLCSPDATRFTSYSAIAGGASELVQCLDDGKKPGAPLLYVHGRTDQVVPFRASPVLHDKVSRADGLGWTVEFDFHDLRGGLAGGHCVPGGKGRFGCGDELAGEKIMKFYIAQSVLAQSRVPD